MCLLTFGLVSPPFLHYNIDLVFLLQFVGDLTAVV